MWLVRAWGKKWVAPLPVAPKLGWHPKKEHVHLVHLVGGDWNICSMYGIIWFIAPQYMIIYIYIYVYISGWWFGTWMVLFSHHIGNFHPSQLTPSFFRGVGQPPTRRTCSCILLIFWMWTRGCHIGCRGRFSSNWYQKSLPEAFSQHVPVDGFQNAYPNAGHFHNVFYLWLMKSIFLVGTHAFVHQNIFHIIPLAVAWCLSLFNGILYILFQFFHVTCRLLKQIRAILISWKRSTCFNLCMFACDVQTSMLGKPWFHGWISDSFCQKQGGLAYFAEYYPPANIR